MMNNTTGDTSADCLKDLRVYNIRTEIGSPTANGHLIAFCIMNAILAIPTILFNGLVITAVFTTASLQGPSYILLTSFAFTDLLVGLVAEPMFMALTLSDVMNNQRVFCALALPVRQVTTSLATASFYSLVAISIDRYLAIRLKMRYKSTVTTARVRIVVVGLWLFSVAIGIVSTLKVVKSLIPAAAVILVASLATLIACYVKSFRALHVYCMQINQDEPSKAEPRSGGDTSSPNSTRRCIDISHYRRVLTTMVLVFTMILICYTPTVCVFGVISFFDASQFTTIAMNYATFAVNMKSLINPILYVLRMREVRDACLVSVRKLKHTVW